MPRTPSSNELHLESLESRLMLSTVTINASGDVGNETMTVVAGSESFDTTVANGFADYTFELDGNYSTSDIRIEFSNDLYDPDNGIDRNLRINSLTVDGEIVTPFSDDVFSTGTWLPEDGITTGLNRGNVLHTNGFIEFVPSDSPTEVLFNGDTWQINSESPSNSVDIDSNTGELVLSGVSGEASVFKQFDVEPGTLMKLSVEGFRDVVSGSFQSDNSPWATFGIDFYTDSGFRFFAQNVELNSDFTTPGGEDSVTFVVPDDVASAFVWGWVNESEQGVEIPLRVSNVSVEVVDQTNDTEPPTVTLEPLVWSSNNSSFINFRMFFKDNVRLNLDTIGTFRIIGANGYNQVARPQYASGNEAETGVFFSTQTADGSDFDAGDNGLYTVTLEEGTLLDQAGNATPGGVIGQFEVAISVG